MSVAAANGTGASMWATRRDDSSSTAWGGNREPGAAFRGISTRGRGRGGGRSRAGGRGGRVSSDRSGIERGDSQRPPNRSEKSLPLNTSGSSSTKPSGSIVIPTGTATVNQSNSPQTDSRRGLIEDNSLHSHTTGW